MANLHFIGLSVPCVVANLALLQALESGGIARPANVPNVGGLLWSTLSA